MSRPNKQNSKENITTAIRLPPEVHAQLAEAAAERDLSVNWLVNRAIAEFLEHLIPVDELRLTRDRSRTQ